MGASVRLPENFSDYLTIDNAQQRFDEALHVAEKAAAAGIPLLQDPDHAAIFTDPPHLVAGPLKQLGYDVGWDARCYPSPVDGCDYINVSARLADDSRFQNKGWFHYVAVVHPVDQAALDNMLGQGYGNPFLHHLTWGIVPPERDGDDDFTYAGRIVAFMVKTRRMFAEAIGDDPGTLIAALPEAVVQHPEFNAALPDWLAGIAPEEHQIETMQGGGFLVQFFVLTGGRIEVALRVGTNQTFNPKSVNKISRDEISAIQD